MKENLAVFDFDHTIINDNSDVAIINLIDRTKIPKEVKELHRKDGWTAFMQAIFEILHENGITEESITNLIINLKEVPGMCELIRYLNELLNYDVIIISDSNSYFIDSWLRHNNLDTNILRVFTNPAEFEGDLLKIKMYQLQDSCKLSTKNLCKGQIMEDFIAEQQQNNVNYQRIIYCGDGVNDYCPILRLKPTDIACVRDKYKCVELVRKGIKGYVDEDGVSRIVVADVCIWTTGYDIINYIK